MLEREVVDLVLGVQRHLPVGGLVDVVAVRVGEALESLPEPGQHLDGVAQRLFEALGRLRRQVDEEEALPDVEMHGCQAELLLLHAVEVLFVRDPPELAFHVERPRVVLAAEPAPAGALLVPYQLVASVRAHVMEGPDLLVLAANDQDRRLADGDVADHVVAGLGDVLDAPNVDPGPAEYLLAFELEVFRRDVRLGREGTGPQLGVGLGPALVLHGDSMPPRP